MEPPAIAVDIGTDHRIVHADYQGEPAGLTVWHRKQDGAWCCGWVSFNGSAWVKSFGGRVQGWDVQQRAPLTLSPSILCRVCGDHGFIREGRWVKA